MQLLASIWAELGPTQLKLVTITITIAGFLQLCCSSRVIVKKNVKSNDTFISGRVLLQFFGIGYGPNNFGVYSIHFISIGCEGWAAGLVS